MDVEYNGKHSVSFYRDAGNGYIRRNSWRDFHLIPASRPFVSLGDANYQMVEIPGSSKRFDITDYRAGGLTFGSRSGSWDFYIDLSKWNDWPKAYNVVKRFIHGNKFLIVLLDNPYAVYQGVLTINSYTPGNNYSKITIHYDLSHEIFILDDLLDPNDTYDSDNGIDANNDNDLEPGEGYDYDEGESYILGSYYPIKFITTSGESAMYGWNDPYDLDHIEDPDVFVVSDLYTIYQQDVIRPNIL